MGSNGPDEDDTPEDGGATMSECLDPDTGGGTWVNDPGDLPPPTDTSNFNIQVGNPDPGSQNQDSFDKGDESGNPYFQSALGSGTAGIWNASYNVVQKGAVATTVVYGGAAGLMAGYSGALSAAARGFGWYYGLTGGTGVVLGTYEEGYLDAAKSIGANALDAAPRVYDFFTDAGEWWTVNQGFIDASIFRGQQFYLNSAPMGTGGFYMEMQYLQSVGVDPFALPWVYIP
jgi:hypothetical protein